jgi:hypothetical protein
VKAGRQLDVELKHLFPSTSDGGERRSLQLARSFQQRRREEPSPPRADESISWVWHADEQGEQLAIPCVEEGMEVPVHVPIPASCRSLSNIDIIIAVCQCQ